MILNNDSIQDQKELQTETTEIAVEQNKPSTNDKQCLSIKEEMLCWGEY
jgi:hypothetical protein